MGKDKSAQERHSYDREIVKKESEIEERLKESQKAQKMLDMYGDDCERSFRRIQELNAEQIRCGSRSTQWVEDEDAGKRRYISQMLVKQRDKIILADRKAVRDLEEERSQLQKKRGELPWD